jgi:exodeoxyribonuclease (lambda-induced)
MSSTQDNAWLEERKPYITATGCSSLEGNNPYETAQEYLRKKVRDLCGKPSEFVMSPAVQHGADMENIARDYYEYHTGNEVTETGLIVHPKHQFLAASPDGLIGLDGCIEIKCPYPKYNKEPYSVFDEKKKMYLWQVYVQMECLDASWCDFFCYLAKDDVSPPKFVLERVQRIDGWLYEPVPGKLLPEPAAGTVQRISLYEAWYEHMHTIAQDEELRQEFLEPAQDEVITVQPTKEMEELSALQQRLADLEETHRDDLEEIAEIKKKSDVLKKSIADQYNCSVTDGFVTVRLINRTPTIDYRKAYEYLGGDQAVLDRGGSPESFRRVNNTRQINIKYGAL